MGVTSWSGTRFGSLVSMLSVGAACSSESVAVAPPPSCDGLAATCGSNATSSCCESLEVPGGTFFRGYDTAPDLRNSDATHPATVSTFRLARHEVKVGRFRQFVNAGMGTQ